MKIIDAVVLDMDGTLFNTKKEISPLTKEALIKIQDNGIQLILASGRPTSSMLPYAKALHMNKHHGLIISYNGACVIDCQNQELLYSKTMDLHVAKSLLEHIKKFHVIPIVYHQDTMYVNPIDNPIIKINNVNTLDVIKYESKGGNFFVCEVEDLSKFIGFPLYKILVAGDYDILSKDYKAIYHPFRANLHGVFSAPFYYEFTAQGVDKAQTLDVVAGHKRIRFKLQLKKCID